MPRSILVIDDEASIRASLSGALKDESFEVTVAGTGEEGLGLIQNQNFDVVLLDVWMPGIDGLETLRRIKIFNQELVVIIMSGHGNIETAVRATKLGAFDFIEKPLSLEKLLVTLRNAFRLNELNRENQLLRQLVSEQVEMVGKSKGMEHLKAQVSTVGPLNSWILITGENGTGKELVAKAIHEQSKRRNKPFVAVNCAAIPEELIESELFGHERGAFTGATQMKRGKFDQANGGTIFLDEIGDMSFKTQAKILRILQEQKFERVGGNQTIEVDVRVFAATNKDLKAEIRDGRFREDLYYRLNVIPVHVPPLRERAEDILPLLEYYFRCFAGEISKPKHISKEALRVLQSYDWPGNIRELKNLVERIHFMTKTQQVDIDDLPAEICIKAAEQLEKTPAEVLSEKLKDAKNNFERAFILKTLQEHDWNVSKTAQTLGIERSHLHRKLKNLKIAELEKE